MQHYLDYSICDIRDVGLLALLQPWASLTLKVVPCLANLADYFARSDLQTFVAVRAPWFCLKPVHVPYDLKLMAPWRIQTLACVVLVGEGLLTSRLLPLSWRKKMRMLEQSHCHMGIEVARGECSFSSGCPMQFACGVNVRACTASSSCWANFTASKYTAARCNSLYWATTEQIVG